MSSPRLLAGVVLPRLFTPLLALALASMPLCLPAQESRRPEQWLAALKEEKLNAADIASGVTLALKAQADKATPWNRAWGDFVQLARAKGALSDELWRDYLVGAVGFRVRVASQAKRSEGLAMWVETEAARGGWQAPQAQGSATLEIELSGVPYQVRSGAPANLKTGGGSGEGRRVLLREAKWAALKPGPQTCHYRYLFQVFEPGGSRAKPGGLIGKGMIQETIGWQLLPEDAEPVPPRLKPDAALGPEIKKSFNRPTVMRDDRDRTLVHVFQQIDSHGPPAGIAFEVWFRVDGDEWRVGPMAWEKGRGGWWAYNLDLPAQVQSGDLVYKPSAAAGARLAAQDPHRLMNLDEIWDGAPLVVSGVPIQTYHTAMVKIAQPTPAEAREYLLGELDPARPAAQQIRREGATAGARAMLERAVRGHPDDAQALFELGCVRMAEGELVPAMESFIATRALKPPTPLERAVQRQQRRICALWLPLAEKDDPAATVALGQAYEIGTGVGQDVLEAKRWYLRGANAGSVEAMNRLASFYERRVGSKVEGEKADQWYRDEAARWRAGTSGKGKGTAESAPPRNAEVVRTAPAPPSALIAQAKIEPLATGLSAREEYDRWVAAHTEKNPREIGRNGEKLPVKLTVTKVEGDGPRRDEGSPFVHVDHLHGHRLTTNGQVWMFDVTSRSVKGGGFTQLEPAVLAEVDVLLAKLPPDAGVLPPPNRKLLIDGELGAGRVVRVYDRANAPAEAWQLLRALGSSIGAWLPEFPAGQTIEARGFAHDGYFGAAPDGKQLVFAGLNVPLQVWEPSTHELIREVRSAFGGRGAFSPDGALFALSGISGVQIFDTKSWAVLHKADDSGEFPQFTPDGRRLLLPTRKPPLLVLDARSGERASRPAEVPPGATRYVPAPKPPRAIAQIDGRGVILWDAAAKREVAMLRPDAVLLDVAFSPDGGFVALSSTRKDRGGDYTQFGIWRMESGAQVHELWPYERRGQRPATGLRWTADGHYVVAGLYPLLDDSNVIGVFNASTGRQGGAFTGFFRLDGLAFAPDETQLFAGCADGKIRVWDFQAALQQVREFEAAAGPAKR